MAFNFSLPDFHPDISNIDELLADTDIQTFLKTDDSVVLKTNWSPLRGGGQSMKSHRLVKVTDDVMEFRLALQSAISYLFMVGIGLLSIVLSLFGKVLGFSGTGNPLFAFAVGVFFSGLGIYLYRKAKVKISINRGTRVLWKGNVDPATVINPKHIEGYATLDKLHAIQVLQKFIESTDTDDTDGYFYSYEINLVMSSGERIALVDQGDRSAAFKQAEQLSEFLDKPLWMAVWPEDGMGNSNWLIKIVRYLKVVGVIIFLAMAGAFLWSLYEDSEAMKERQLKLDALSPTQRTQLAAKRTKELFDLVKSSTVNFPEYDRLVREGADIYAKDDQERTLLFYAVKTKNGDYIREFLRKGADIHVKDKLGVGLKDMLDPLRDKLLYYTIVDAELEEDAQSRGKTVISIDRKFDSSGCAIYERVYER